MKLKTLTIAMVVAAMIPSAFAAQPNMRDALEHLRAARAALMQAERNKAGHRERAIGHVDAAIREVEAGMAAAR